MAAAAELARRCDTISAILNHTGMPVERTAEDRDRLFYSNAERIYRL